MTIFIDRRKNPKGKNLPNKQRFFNKAKKSIIKTIKDSIRNKKIEDIGNNEKVIIPASDLEEHIFGHDFSSGKKHYIFSGNDRFDEGDMIEKSNEGSGEGQGKNKASKEGNGEDNFVFVLNRDEFLEFFFEDLELPNLVRKNLKIIENYKLQREGFSNTGPISNLDIIKSYKSSLGRRIALKRPNSEELDEYYEKLKKAKEDNNEEEIKKLEIIIDEMERKIKIIPFISDIDLKYRRYEYKPIYISSAVMFCLMDVSGSMTELKKDYAKRFFLLLYIFLQKFYKKVDIVFIRHTNEAKEVTEEEFFNSKETGGTVVSTALELSKEIIQNKYPPNSWNIYICQASDGDNYNDDNQKVVQYVNELLDITQYYSYIQIDPDEERSNIFFKNGNRYSDPDNLFNVLNEISKSRKNIQCKIIFKKSQIWEVFRELFKKEK